MRKTTEKALTSEQKKKIRELVEVYYDYQDCRIGTSNRLALKKDGEEQDKEFPQVPLGEIPEIVDILDNSKELFSKIRGKYVTSMVLSKHGKRLPFDEICFLLLNISLASCKRE